MQTINFNRWLFQLLEIELLTFLLRIFSRTEANSEMESKKKCKSLSVDGVFG